MKRTGRFSINTPNEPKNNSKTSKYKSGGTYLYHHYQNIETIINCVDKRNNRSNVRNIWFNIDRSVSENLGKYSQVLNRVSSQVSVCLNNAVVMKTLGRFTLQSSNILIIYSNMINPISPFNFCFYVEKCCHLSILLFSQCIQLHTAYRAFHK